jgi:6-phosphogluconolactonase
MASTAALRVSPDTGAATAACAAHLAARLEAVLAVRDDAHLALSGGSTGARLCRTLAALPVAWRRVHVYQVDERIVPDGHPDRNATALLHELVQPAAVPGDHVHLLPVTAADLDGAAAAYGAALPRLDIIHLGIGPDGHTASWPPEQPEVRTRPAPVTVTAEFNGHRRMTLTAAPIAAAREVVWLICGADKRDTLHRALSGDPGVPAAHAMDERSVVFADAAAAPCG